MSGARFVLEMAWRESRAAWRRMAVLTASLSIGVAALVAIGSFTDNLQDSVRSQSQGLLGADLALSSGAAFSAKAEATLQDLRAKASRPGRPAEVARATSFAAMAYVPRTSGSRLVQVVGVEGGYPFYGRLATEPPGEWPRLSSGEFVLVDPSLLIALDAKVGDALALGESRFTIQGTVHNFPGDVAMRTAFGPRAFVAAKHLAGTGLLGFGSRARHEAFLRIPEGVNGNGLADARRPALAAERVSLRTVADDERNRVDALGRLARYLALVALTALLLGGLGVASAVHVFIKRKIDTVAMLRCLGASGRRVMAVYLVQAAALGLLGSLAGAALGLAIQVLLPAVLHDFLPVDVSFSLSWSALATGVGTGLWVSVVFSLLPLLSVRSISPLVVLRRDYEPPPRQRDPLRWAVIAALVLSVVALSILQAGGLGMGLTFAAAIGAALGLLWAIARAASVFLRRHPLHRWPYVWRQGVANLHRPANQTVTVVLALGFGAFLLSTLVLVQHNLLRELRVDGGSDRPNLVLFDIQPDQRGPVEEKLRHDGWPVREAVPIVPMRITSVKGKEVTKVLAQPSGQGRGGGGGGRWALRREYRSTYRDRLVASEQPRGGAMWKPGEWKGTGPRSGEPVPVSLEEGLAAELGVKLGDEILWDVQGLEVRSRLAALRLVSWARFEPNFFVVFPEGPLDAAPQTFVTLTRIEDPARRARLQRELAEAFPNVTAVDLAQIQEAVEGIVARVILAIRFMALFSLATGAVVLAGAVAASRYQRLKEGALLKTLGATRGQVLRILCAEYLSLGLLASLSALALSAAAGWALMRFFFESRFMLPVAPLAALGAGVVALTLMVGLWSSLEVFRRTSLEVLRSE